MGENGSVSNVTQGNLLIPLKLPDVFLTSFHWAAAEAVGAAGGRGEESGGGGEGGALTGRLKELSNSENEEVINWL